MSASDTLVAAEAQTALPELLDRVERGERITITRDGRAVARLVPALPGHDVMAAQAAVDDLFRLREELAREGVGPFTLDEIRSAIREGRKY